MIQGALRSPRGTSVERPDYASPRGVEAEDLHRRARGSRARRRSGRRREAALQAGPPADFLTKRLFDIGVADPDRNGRLDIFTTNHKFKSVFLRNHRGRSFRNVINQIGLGPDDRYPGLDLLRPPADLSAPGIYVWPSDEPGDAGRLHLQSTGLTVSGRVRLMTREADDPLAAPGHGGGRPRREQPPVHRLHDRARRRGDLRLERPLGSADPVRVRGVRPGRRLRHEIKVGTEAVSPDAPLFQIKLRDRHALAFADVAGDRDQDVFVATGGLGGGIASPRFLGSVVDQLLVAGAGPGGTYADAIGPSGIVKGYCRGRSASYADADGRGSLDLLLTCEGTAPAALRADDSRRIHHRPGAAGRRHRLSLGRASAARVRRCSSRPGAASSPGSRRRGLAARRNRPRRT